MKLKRKLFHLSIIFKALRPHQWIKNLSLYGAIIFSGNLFNLNLFWQATLGFLVFSALSSASYIFNDIIDEPFDKKHPVKKNRPIASGLLKKSTATEIAFILAFAGIAASFFVNIYFFIMSAVFLLLHIFYTLYFKKQALLDILLIASSFLIRIFSGQVATGLHLPIWLMFSVIFLSLFIASCKRRSELSAEGATTRPTLLQYRTQLLDFYNSTFATGTIVTYAMFTFQNPPPVFNRTVTEFLLFTFPQLIGRKWLMATTLPLVLIGIMRYAQLIYEREGSGEAPEKLVTSDKPLIWTIVAWGISIVLFTYIL